jgi:hypothetical protein
MSTLTKSSIVLFLVGLIVQAETTVFVDATFPYRIVCKTGWLQELKNDSMLILKNSASGKKTRLQLQKYSMDSGYDVNNKDWSRLRYAINKELATAVGQLIFVDTSAQKKLGNSRAFEIFAFFSEKSNNKTLWWAEYSRWTDYNGSGYLASIIGDTTDMKENYVHYKALMDSVSLSQLPTKAGSQWVVRTLATQPHAASLSSVWYDILGRNTNGATRQPNVVLVKKNLKFMLVQ